MLSSNTKRLRSVYPGKYPFHTDEKYLILKIFTCLAGFRGVFSGVSSVMPFVFSFFSVWIFFHEVKPYTTADEPFVRR